MGSLAWWLQAKCFDVCDIKTTKIMGVKQIYLLPKKVSNVSKVVLFYHNMQQPSNHLSVKADDKFLNFQPPRNTKIVSSVIKYEELCDFLHSFLTPTGKTCHTYSNKSFRHS